MVANVGGTNANVPRSEAIESMDSGGGGGRMVKPGSKEWNEQVRQNTAKKYGLDFLLPGNRKGTTFPNFQPVVDKKKGINTGFQLPGNVAWMAANKGMVGTPPAGTLNTAALAQTPNPLFGGGSGFMIPGNRPSNPYPVVQPTTSTTNGVQTPERWQVPEWAWPMYGWS